MADFRHLPTHCKFIALMPQWDFLNFLAEHGKRYKTFDLRMQAEATDLIEENGRVVGVIAKTPDGALTIRADLVVGCDGRHSTVREKAGLKSDDYGAPMDVLWFRLPRKDSDSADTFGHIEAGKLMVMLDRGDYWQCAYVIPKGGIDSVKSAGLEAFRGRIVEMSPFLSDRVGELKSWDDVKLLSVTVDRLRKWWRPGLLCIGDAAHAMSPIGGVGINMAVQDAVAAANRLAGPLRAGKVTDEDLQAIQQRRTLPVRFTQWLQLTIQRRIISRVLESSATTEAAAVLQALRHLSGIAPHSRAVDRRRHSSRARAHAGSGAGLMPAALSPPPHCSSASAKTPGVSYVTRSIEKAPRQAARAASELREPKRQAPTPASPESVARSLEFRRSASGPSALRRLVGRRSNNSRAGPTVGNDGKRPSIVAASIAVRVTWGLLRNGLTRRAAPMPVD